MKEKKKGKRRFILFIWTFLTALLLTMTTYAWFSVNRIFEVESFDIQIASKGGIEVSTDAINWQGVVGILDFMRAQETYLNNLNQIPNAVKPVSSAGETEGGLLKLFYGEVGHQDYYYINAVREEESSALMDDSRGSFVAFDLFLKTLAPKKLSIAKESGIYYTGEDETPSGIENAFRMAFLNLGTLNEDSPLNQIQNQRNTQETFIWEQNYDRHQATAVAHAQAVYGINTTEFNAPRILYDGIRANIPEALKLDVSMANEDNYPQYFKRVNPDLLTRSDNNTVLDFIDIEAGITKLRIYIWLEGQDVDCEDYAAYGDLTINLQFIAHEKE